MRQLSARVPLIFAVLAVLTAPVAALGQPPAAQVEPDAEAEEVDWRGLYRMDENGHTIKRAVARPPNPIRELAQGAPYRVHVASSDGKKITITDAYTLERWRVFTAADVRGYAFSNDGHWLYVVHDAGIVTSVAVPTAKAHVMTTVKLAEGEQVIEVIGHGTVGHRFVTVVVGVGPRPLVGAPCAGWTRVRRFRVRQKSGWDKATTVIERGNHELRRSMRRKRTSPNTRYEVILGASLTLNNRIGGGSVGRLNKSALPRDSIGVHWMRDSRGVVVKNRRPPSAGCRYHLGIVSFRQPESQRSAWRRQRDWTAWAVPDDVDLVRGDLAHEDLQWAPDEMRLIGVRAGLVVLVEPAARHRGHVAVVAPATALWPAVRPGVRGLASGTGSLRHAEILAEQGDLASATRQLAEAAARAPAPAAAAVARLRKRLKALGAVRARRAGELGLSGGEPQPDRVPPAVDATAGSAVKP